MAMVFQMGVENADDAKESTIALRLDRALMANRDLASKRRKDEDGRLKTAIPKTASGPP